MSQLAIGMIETVGLAAGIEAADVCVKSANVTLIGYELTKGNGMTVVKIEGNVGAVKAAIEAATVAASKISSVFSTKVIPRPSNSIDFLMRNSNTVGYEKETIKNKEEYNEICDEVDNTESQNQESFNDKTNQEDIPEENSNIEENTSVETLEDNNNNPENKSYTCNLCKDPNCPRQKGDFKTNCIHYKEDQNK